MMFLVLACANKCVSGFTEVVVSPPYVFLPFVKSLLRSDFHVAAQNAWVSKGGAYTGEIRYIIHSCLVSSIYFGVLHLVLLAMTQGFWSFNVRLNHVIELSGSLSLFLYRWFIDCVAHILEVSTYHLICVYCVFSVNSAEMLVNLDIPWVILGHSERRQLLNESNEVQIFQLSLVYILKFPLCASCVITFTLWSCLYLQKIRFYLLYLLFFHCRIITVCRRQSCLCTFTREESYCLHWGDS
jgi:hypothetical protein